ncbi:MAG: helix-turn-helix transcriptional regulator [Rubrobacteraceae bacterium]|uniref:response regulator transcription factor n=1 Tax=Rubrobacter naiadicus TaxID=1392641 RepID=UPI0030810E61|nr:helix-turn-helix transcriptional regulator [Rubrobacteraceae bacterium]
MEGVRPTARELTVLELIVRRLTNEEIAERLHLAPQTVKNHAGSIFAKLGYRGRKELYRAWGA